MSLVLDYLTTEGARLDLARHGAAGPLTAVWLTPRFRASTHTVALVLPADGGAPVLVAKVPRLSEADAALTREASNLRALAALGDGAAPGTPALVAFERFRGWPILVQTALDGRAWDRTMVRRDPEGACRAGADWLARLHARGGPAGADEASWYDRLIARPLDALREATGGGAMVGDAGATRDHGAAGDGRHSGAMIGVDGDGGASVAAQVRRTLALASAIHDARLPLVMEHGDFSAPNVMCLPGGRVGVVDWELADPRGLPACDLFFWLTYVAFARAGASSPREQVAAFTDAFWGRAAWARPHVARYAEAVGIDPAWLTPLFVLTWARTVAGLVQRLHQAGAGGAGGRAIDARTVAWLNENRYSALWRVALDRADELSWTPDAATAAAGRRTDRRPDDAGRPQKARSRWLAWR